LIAKVVDISKIGAAVRCSSLPSAGSRGTLEVSRFGMTLPFIVRTTENDTMHVAFELDAAAASRFAAALDQSGLSRAA
jgi:hypothetical protein